MKPFGKSSMRGVLVEIKLAASSGVSSFSEDSSLKWVEDHRSNVSSIFSLFHREINFSLTVVVAVPVISLFAYSNLWSRKKKYTR